MQHLYQAASGTMPYHEFRQLALPQTAPWDDDEIWAVTVPPLNAHHTHVILTDAVASCSSKERIAPEMMMALQTEISCRLLVDAWQMEYAAQRPYNAVTEERNRKHRWWTKMLQERMEILRPEYERWHSNAAESLATVCDEVLLISAAD